MEKNENTSMTAKEYLREIRKMDLAIDQKQDEFDSLIKKRTYVGSMDYSSERVQTSPDGSGFTGIADRLADMQAEINEEIDRYHDVRHERINQIQQLSKTEYVDILFRRYVQYQSFETISSEMQKSYHRICHLHGEALKEFENKFLKTATNSKT